MCGIAAYFSRDPASRHVEIVSAILGELLTRGVHAFGVSFLNGLEIVTVKSFRPLTKAQISLAVGSGAAIFHNRYSTSGDWRDQRNNQPIDVGSLAVAVNGVTSMAPPDEWAHRFGVECESQNDAEIVARLLASRPADQVVSRRDIGSLAACWLTLCGGVFVARNSTRPARLVADCGAVFVASTTAAIAAAFGGPVGRPVPAGEVIDLRRVSA
jgi:glutamine phosphoribosylpyrophosphate amidotransferase